MNAKQLSMIGLLVFALVAMTGLVSAIPVVINEVQVDGTELASNAANRLDIERGDEVQIRVELESTSDLDDVEILAIMTGYEYNDIVTERLSANVGPFDMNENVTYVKKLSLSLPTDVDVDEYKLRIIVSDRDGDELVENYNLLIDAPRHDLVFRDVIFTPNGRVTAGAAMLTTVRLENNGQRDEDDVKVTVSVPELGVSASDFIDSVDADEQEETEEMYFRLPECAEPGVYDVKVDAWYNDGRRHMSKTESITVLENSRCKPVEPAAPAAPVVTEPAAPAAPAAVATSSTVRKLLETVLLVLLALLIVVGLIVGFSKLAARSDDD